MLTLADEALRHGEVIRGRVRLHYVEMGNGPLVIFLHGFPEYWYSWRHQLPALATGGYRALALDQRGYNLSSKPPGVASYRMQHLVADVAEVIHHAGAEGAVVVGHDWGGAIAWHVALRHPELVEKLVILNAPHPAIYLRELKSPRQLLKSWYVFFFQLPGLPELLLRAGDFALLRRTLRHDPVRPDAFSTEDIQRYREALARPGALTATINYYRAALRHVAQATRGLPVLDTPTLVIWGERDRYLDLCLLDGLDQWVRHLGIARLPHASHWVQNDAPEEVNRLLLEFLGKR